MLIDFQIPAHLCEQIAADFFLPILEGGEFFAKYKRPWLPLPLSRTNWQVTLRSRASFRMRRSNSAPFTASVSDTSVRVVKLRVSGWPRQRAWPDQNSV